MNTMQTSHGTVHVFSDGKQLQSALAQRFVLLAQDAVKAQGRFTVAFSGGSTPKALYELLADDSFKMQIPWEAVHVFWGDERCVPHTSPESNYKMAYEALLSKVDIPAANIHPTVGQADNPERSALLYESSICNMFGAAGADIPGFDLVLLGLGPEGHTASLFPGSPALQPGNRLVAAVFVEKFNSYRITFTPRLINHAAHIIFMVSGEGKQDILPQVLKNGPAELPAQYIRPESGLLEWYVDQPAAAKLLNSKLSAQP
jgi:6-phosphogluconolactonase